VMNPFLGSATTNASSWLGPRLAIILDITDQILSHRGRRLIATYGLLITFAVVATRKVIDFSLQDFVGIDLRIYRAAAQAALTGQNPWPSGVSDTIRRDPARDPGLRPGGADAGGRGGGGLRRAVRHGSAIRHPGAAPATLVDPLPTDLREHPGPEPGRVRDRPAGRRTEDRRTRDTGQALRRGPAIAGRQAIGCRRGPPAIGTRRAYMDHVPGSVRRGLREARRAIVGWAQRMGDVARGSHRPRPSRAPRTRSVVAHGARTLAVHAIALLVYRAAGRCRCALPSCSVSIPLLPAVAIVLYAAQVVLADVALPYRGTAAIASQTAAATSNGRTVRAPSS
jgi:hypothetical protein